MMIISMLSLLILPSYFSYQNRQAISLKAWEIKTTASMRVEQGIHLSLAPTNKADHSSDGTQEILLRPTWRYEL